MGENRANVWGGKPYDIVEMMKETDREREICVYI